MEQDGRRARKRRRPTPEGGHKPSQSHSHQNTRRENNIPKKHKNSDQNRAPQETTQNSSRKDDAQTEPAKLPGYYYDPESKRYFKIDPRHPPPQFPTEQPPGKEDKEITEITSFTKLLALRETSLGPRINFQRYWILRFHSNFHWSRSLYSSSREDLFRLWEWQPIPEEADSWGVYSCCSVNPHDGSVLSSSPTGLLRYTV